MQNIIAIIALILAYLAYRKSIVDEYSSWLNLMKSFKAELNYAKSWIGGSYPGDSQEDWKDPTKLVYPLTVDAAKSLITKGYPPQGLFPDNFFTILAKYIERIEAFNHFLLLQGINFVLSDKNNTSSEKALYLNRIIHNELIGNSNQFHLHNHFQYFNCEFRIIEDHGLSKIPWYFKYPKVIVVISIVFYLFLDYFLR